MKRTSKRSAGLAGWSKTQRICVGIGVYLVIGLVWSLVMLATSGGNGETVNGPSIGSNILSVGVTTVLWLPLWLISSL